MSINERIRKEAQRIRDEADVAIGRARAELQRSRNTFFDSDVTLNQIGICREEIERAEKHIKDGQYQFAAEAYASSDIRMYRLVFVHKDCPLPKDFCTSEQIFTEAARNITARTQEFIGQGRLREAGQFLGGYMRAVT
ncbi:MAG: hypothetical protein HY053_05445, partial [Proteobacteria bacterium]|nr:hypothetical protein [Pseudomonadota bacterium]